MSGVDDRGDGVEDKAIARAVGHELRSVRDANGWSRDALIARMPSGITDRTLLTYEHGTRHLTLLRFLEICQALDTGAPQLLGLALQRAKAHLANLAVQVDLRALVADHTDEFRSMTLWAHNKLIQCPEGVAELTPAALRELATLMGSTHHALAAYLTQFTPNPDHLPEDDDHAN